MSYDDPDLETRLRRIAASPQPDPPASLYRLLDQVARGGRAGTSRGDLLPFVAAGRVRSGLRRVGAIASVAAALVFALSVTALFVATRGQHDAAMWTLRADAGQGQWTGLEWHDITASSGGVGMDSPLTGTDVQSSGSIARWLGWRLSGSLVKWRGGFAVIGGNWGVWLSKDGLEWTDSTGSPRYGVLAALGGDLVFWGSGMDPSHSGLWRSPDGVSWMQVPAPAELTSVSTFVAGKPGVVAVTTAPNSGVPPGPSSIFFSTDANDWTRATLPSAMAAARNLYVQGFLSGFVAIGLVSDPGGTEIYNSGAADEQRYSYRSWISNDGLTWKAYDPALSSSLAGNVPPWTQIQSGRLGSGNGLIYTTDGGVTWTRDSDLIPNWLGDDQIVSDGTRIVMSAGSGARFYLSEGDGHWVQLQQGGDIVGLPAIGQPLLLPNGILWIGANHVYFGQALSGVASAGSLGPPITPSPGITAPYPTSTPAVVEPATNPPGALGTGAATTK